MDLLEEGEDQPLKVDLEKNGRITAPYDVDDDQ
jgi:hypothetical protein